MKPAAPRWRVTARAAAPGLLTAAAIGAAAVLARRNEKALPRVAPLAGLPAARGGTLADGGPEARGAGAEAAIDVIVPARDEAARIARCVTALLAQGPGVGVHVVDDGSTDGTAARARAAGAFVLRLDAGPPPGWTGKTHACHRGAELGRAPWLAFVDADVALAPGALPALVAHAEAAALDAVSPLLRQRCGGLADSLVVPLAYWQYAVGMGGVGSVGARERRRALLNGQCLVVRRGALAAVGGHGGASVRGTAVEDAALARALAGAGRRVGLVRGEALGDVRMYGSARALRLGFLKNAAELIAADRRRGALVVGTGVALSRTLGLLAGAARRPPDGRTLGAAAAYAAGVAALAPRYRASAVHPAAVVAHPVAAVVLQAIAIESVLRAAARRPAAWKGRPPVAPST